MMMHPLQSILQESPSADRDPPGHAHMHKGAQLEPVTSPTSATLEYPPAGASDMTAAESPRTQRSSSASLAKEESAIRDSQMRVSQKQGRKDFYKTKEV